MRQTITAKPRFSAGITGSTSSASQLFSQHSSSSSLGYTAPTFTYTFRNRSFREGQAVKLNCEVLGNPRPQIQWYFNRKTIEASRKYLFKHDKTELIVYPFLDSDIGYYSCEAWNNLGRIESGAQIGIIRSHPPIITEGPQTSRTNLGEKAVFICKARGDPKPSVTWFFDGTEIPPELKGHFKVKNSKF